MFRPVGVPGNTMLTIGIASSLTYVAIDRCDREEETAAAFGRLHAVRLMLYMPVFLELYGFTYLPS